MSVERVSKRSGAQRLQFIDFRLRWDGRLNRVDLTEFFGISIPQASLDLAKYQEMAPGNTIYDHRSRAYLATRSFRPLYPESNDAKRYFLELEATARGVLPQNASFIGWSPPVEVCPSLVRDPDAVVAAEIVSAIREGMAVRIHYQSMSRPEPTTRTITPHALVNNGLRWHVRAFCHLRRNYLDFVLGRILAVEGTEPGVGDAKDDGEWNSFVEFVIQPNSHLSPTMQKALELEYGMNGGTVSFQCREALAFYTARRLDLIPRVEARPEEQQVTLKNWEELKPLLEKHA